MPKPKFTDSTKPRKRDWEHNQDIIGSAFWDITSRKNKMPTLKEVAAKTGLSAKTIERHLQEMPFQKHKEKLRAIEDKMLIIFANKTAKSNNSNMWELYFTMTNGEVIRKQQIDHTSGGEKMTSLNISVVSEQAKSEIENLRKPGQ